MEEQINSLEKEFKELQDSFAMIDLMSNSTSGKGLLTEILLKRILPLEFRMEPDTHKTPHLHISYGINKHAASYSLIDGKPIVGEIPSKYDKKAKTWIDANQQILMQIWEELKKGNQSGYEGLIKKL
ncbi:DUF4160 domain-containing protein [uncultured Flavobacterium sp.]|uniref:DUF4160 domain-containing protein n=1 Tax=uncultured Flavobacterium sp. TaxID=165435 RepID=UPI00292D9FAC|nr:DUF4160 domain-containing protein [uncultured Flavobacterium sp.]